VGLGAAEDECRWVKSALGKIGLAFYATQRAKTRLLCAFLEKKARFAHIATYLPPSLTQIHFEPASLMRFSFPRRMSLRTPLRQALPSAP